MTVANTLMDAARLVPENLTPMWAADTLMDAMVSFAGDLYDEFPVSTPNNAPIANWLAVIGAFAPTILDFAQATSGNLTTGVNTIQTYETASEYIYRLCKFADAYATANLITSAQADAILAAYNARFS